MLINHSEKIKQFNKKFVENFDLHLHKMFADKLASSRPYPIKKFDAHLHKTFGLSDNSLQSNVYEYVDLGLPSGTLWATRNVGASKPEDYGDYFAWGEITGYESGKTDFSWETYQHCNGTEDTLTKYCTNSKSGNEGYIDHHTILFGDDDAVVANSVSNEQYWEENLSEESMPSNTQFDELINSSYTTTEWTTQNDIYGLKITSKSNENSIFLPAAGYRQDTSLIGADLNGYYWSNVLDADTRNAQFLYFNPDDMELDYSSRCCGLSIRPVKTLSEGPIK